MHLLITGPQGSGKGTQAAMLKERLGIAHLSVGERLREEVAARTPLGLKAGALMESGSLVPDELTFEIAQQYLQEHDDFILDGFPRTLEQARWLDSVTRIDAAIFLTISDAVAVERIAGRRECPRGHDYHIAYNPPREARVCDVDGLPLRQRSDDTEESVLRRLALYHKETARVLDHYKERVLQIDGGQPIAKVHLDIMRALRDKGISP